MHELKLFGKRSKEKYHSYKGKIGKVADNIINRVQSRQTFTKMDHGCI